MWTLFYKKYYLFIVQKSLNFLRLLSYPTGHHTFRRCTHLLLFWNSVKVLSIQRLAVYKFLCSQKLIDVSFDLVQAIINYLLSQSSNNGITETSIAWMHTTTWMNKHFEDVYSTSFGHLSGCFISSMEAVYNTFVETIEDFLARNQVSNSAYQISSPSSSATTSAIHWCFIAKNIIIVTINFKKGGTNLIVIIAEKESYPNKVLLLE